MNAEEKTSDPLSRSQRLELLMKMHAALRQDVLLQVGSLKNHVRNTQFVLSIFVTATLASLNSPNFALTNDTKYYWIFVMILITTVTYYLLYDVFDSGFSINVVGEVLGSLERRVNKIAEEELLMWDCVTERLYGSPFSLRGVLQPLWMVGIYQVIAISMVTVALPCFVYWLAWSRSNGGIEILVTAALGASYSIISAVVASYAAIGISVHLRGRAREFIDGAWKQPS